jgi:2-polyprenyl-3-methyl-5-hydroxy-6-metoxy-1,4-benzoquinol methylase
MTKLDLPVAFDAELGIVRLDPLPDEGALNRLYSHEYHGRSDESRAPDIRRLAGADVAAERERNWRWATVYPDVMAIVEKAGLSGGRALDVGCGGGEFVEFLTSHGFDALGVEPSDDAAISAQSRGIDVRQGTIESVGDLGRFDLITMLNVLEHVHDPVRVVEIVRVLLVDDGVLVVQVPNDFSPIQEAVRLALDLPAWWVAAPDHVNYFDFASLERFLHANGFAAVDRYTSFPMEFFLLSDLNYVAEPAVGADAHQRRCDFELALRPEERQQLYRSFAAAGLGRAATVVAQKLN